jgi:EKC/KEOPS complex subunit PCC1/LAGE3
VGKERVPLHTVSCSCRGRGSWSRINDISSHLIEYSDIRIPFPTARLANIAIRSLSVDPELSSLVRRSLEVVEASIASQNGTQTNGTAGHDKTVLKVIYAATTNRMLRVAVNGFFESLGLVVQVMEDLDEDVVMKPGTQELTGVQGLEESRALD